MVKKERPESPTILSNRDVSRLEKEGKLIKIVLMVPTNSIVLHAGRIYHKSACYGEWRYIGERCKYGI